MRAVAVEGDSTNYTRIYLREEAWAVGLNLDIVTCNHGGPVYGSTEDPARMAAVSRVGNAMLASVAPSDNIVIYVESDLIWSAETILHLITHVDDLTTYHPPDADIVAPLVFAGDHFYDVWAFRGLDGARFAPFAPYHSQLHKDALTTVSSVGSCLVMRAEVARECRIRNSNALVGFCEDARFHGYTIKVDPTQRIEHPA